MPLQETLDTYRYCLTEADKLHPAYVALSRHFPAVEMEFDGVFLDPLPEIYILTNSIGKKRATDHDVFESYRPFIKNAKLFLNGEIAPTEAAELVESGKVDGVFFGRLWITHPDVAKRVQNGKALDNVMDYMHLQTGKNGDFSVGYTDYPAAVL